MINTKTNIVTQARSWLGTPYHHQGRVKHVGADCIGLLVGVFGELNLFSKKLSNENTPLLLKDFDDTSYSFQPNGDKLAKTIEQHLYLKDIKNLEAGDVVLMQWLKDPQHVAIISNYGDSLGLIHIYRGSGKCVEHSLDESWFSKIVHAYEVVQNG